MKNAILIGITTIAVTVIVVVLAGEGWSPLAYAFAGLSAIWLILFGYANSGGF